MASSNEMVQATVPFFDGKGYAKWRFKMEVFFKYHDLLDIVTKDIDISCPKSCESSRDPLLGEPEIRVDVERGNFQVPEESNSSTVLQKKDVKALYFIHQSVSDAVFEKIARTNAKTAAKAWRAIEDQYKPPDQLSAEELPIAREPGPYPRPNDRKHRSYCNEMFHAAVSGDWEKAEKIIDKKFPEIVRTGITDSENTALHVAVDVGKTHFVKKLVEKMNEDDILLQNKQLATALGFAAWARDTEIAKAIVARNPRAVSIPNAQSYIPLHEAALAGDRNMVLYLYGKTDLNGLREAQLNQLFHFLIESGQYDKALEMLEDNKSLAMSQVHGSTPLQLLARKPLDIPSKHQLGYFMRSIYSRIFREAWQPMLARRLVQKLWKTVLQNDEGTTSKSDHISMMLDAAATGNDEFIVMIILSHPGPVWQADRDWWYLFSAAATNRQDRIFNLIYEMPSLVSFIGARVQNSTGNTMLHLVASLPPPEQLQVVTGPALQLQRELLWFEAVKNIMPKHYAGKRNHDGELAHELIAKHHKELLNDGKEWMKNTASSCMLVATLVATVAFAFAFTVLGGNDEEKGVPILKSKPESRNWLNIFAVSDAVAMLTSVLSGVLFLSILPYQYAEQDFRRSLPLQLMAGLLVLATSVTAMLLAFCASFFLMYTMEDYWISIFSISLASGVALAYGLLHGRLVFDTLKATTWLNIIFPPWRRRIFHRRLPFPLSWVVSKFHHNKINTE